MLIIISVITSLHADLSIRNLKVVLGATATLAPSQQLPIAVRMDNCGHDDEWPAGI